MESVFNIKCLHCDSTNRNESGSRLDRIFLQTRAPTQAFVMFQMNPVIIRSLSLVAHMDMAFFHFFFVSVSSLPVCIPFDFCVPIFSTAPLLSPDPSSLSVLRWQVFHQHLPVSGIKAGAKISGRYTACCETGAKLPLP